MKWSRRAEFTRWLLEEGGREGGREEGGREGGRREGGREEGGVYNALL